MKYVYILTTEVAVPYEGIQEYSVEVFKTKKLAQERMIEVYQSILKSEQRYIYDDEDKEIASDRYRIWASDSYRGKITKQEIK